MSMTNERQRPPGLTLELARKLERAVAEGYTSTHAKDPLERVLERRFGAAIAIKRPEAPWRNGVFCLTTADMDKLGDIIAYFQDDGVGCSFHVAPMGFSPELGRALSAVGFLPSHAAQAILYGLPAKELVRPAIGVTVEPVTERSLDDFIETNVEGFEYPPDWRAGIKASLRRRFGREDYHPYLARLDGKPAGAAALVKQGDIACLVDASVVPAMRGKGCHSALLQERLQAAGELGCRWVLGAADHGSASFRNQCRGGLQMAYLETTWQKP
jgi:GNAT superfamily N-acetyltransferase